MRSLALLFAFLVYLPSIFLQPFCGILLWTWFSIMNPHRLVWGVGAMMPYAMVIALATLGAWIMSREPKTPPMNAVSLAFVGLMVTISASTLIALAPDLAYEKWDRVFKTLVMSVLALALLRNKVRIHAFVWVMVLSLGYYGLKGGAFAILTGGAYRVWGPEGTYIFDNNHLALALVMAIPMMHYLQRHSQVRWVRLGLLGLQICSVISAIASYSRGSVLGLMIMACLFWWRSPKKLPIAAFVAVFGIVMISAVPQQWFDRMNTISTYQEDASAMSRIAIWKAALAIFSHNPVLGGGFRATYSPGVIDQYAPGTTIARAVHNSHLEVLVENGVIGFFFHIVLVGATWTYGQRVRRMTKNRPDLLWARDLAAMLQTSLVGYLAGGTFLSLGYYDGWFNIAIAMAALHTLIARQIKQELAEPGRAASELAYPPAAARAAASYRRGN